MLSGRNEKGRLRRVFEIYEGMAALTIKVMVKYRDYDGDEVVESKKIEFMIKGKDRIQELKKLRYGALIVFDWMIQEQVTNRKNKETGEYERNGKYVQYPQSLLVTKFEVKEDGSGDVLGEPRGTGSVKTAPSGKAKGKDKVDVPTVPNGVNF